MGTRFNKARFHVEMGLKSFFDRIGFTLRERHELPLHASHFQQRAYAHDAPLDLIKSFDPGEWELMTAEARAATGNFVNSA